MQTKEEPFILLNPPRIQIHHLIILRINFPRKIKPFPIFNLIGVQGFFYVLLPWLWRNPRRDVHLLNVKWTWLHKITYRECLHSTLIFRGHIHFKYKPKHSFLNAKFFASINLPLPFLWSLHFLSETNNIRPGFWKWNAWFRSLVLSYVDLWKKWSGFLFLIIW